MNAGESIDRFGPSIRVVVAIAISVFVLVSIATPVVAHAYLSESNPSNGEQVETIPDEVTLSFSGDGIQVAEVSVTGPNGSDISDDARIDADDSQVVHVPIETGEAGDGMYTVQWEILADDGHSSSGSFFFSVGDEPLDRDAVLAAYEDGDDETDEGVPLIEAIAKGLLLITLVGIVGIPVTVVGVIYPLCDRFGAATGATDQRLTKLLTGLGILIVASAFVLGLARSTAVGSFSIDTVLQFSSTPLGRVWITQLALSTILLLVFIGAGRGIYSRRVWLGTALCGGLLVGATVSWSSHSATAIDRLLGTALDFAHITGAGLWIGGLLILAIVVPPLLREIDPANRDVFAAEIVRRYSILALIGVTLAVTTGLILASWHVPTVEGLPESLYGISLSAKVLLVLVALGLGGFTRFVLLRHLEASNAQRSSSDLVGRSGDTQLREDGGTAKDTSTLFSRAIRIEVVVLVLILLLSGLLTSIPTAAISGQEQGGGPEIATVEQEADDITIELEALPATHSDERETGAPIGIHTDEPVVLQVTFVRNGEPLQSERPVRLLATHLDSDTTMEIELEETDTVSYATVQTLPDNGTWEIRVSGAPDGSFVNEWFETRGISDAATGSHDHEDMTGSDTPFTKVLQFSAIAVALIGSVAVVLESVRFGRRENKRR